MDFSRRRVLVFIGLLSLVLGGFYFLGYEVLVASSKDDPVANPMYDPDFDPVYENDEGMLVGKLKNLGDKNFSGSDVSVSFRTSDKGYRRFSELSGNWKMGNASFRCLDNLSLAPGEMVSCSSGLRFPEKGESVGIRIEVGAGRDPYTDEKVCEVYNEEARTC